MRVLRVGDTLLASRETCGPVRRGTCNPERMLRRPPVGAARCGQGMWNQRGGQKGNSKCISRARRGTEGLYSLRGRRQDGMRTSPLLGKHASLGEAGIGHQGTQDRKNFLLFFPFTLFPTCSSRQRRHQITVRAPGTGAEPTGALCSLWTHHTLRSSSSVEVMGIRQDDDPVRKLVSGRGPERDARPPHLGACSRAPG